MIPDVSVVIPVYNEDASLPALFARLFPVLDALAKPYEVVFVDDGSTDRTGTLLRAQTSARPDVARTVVLAGNVGQHMAILAGFAHAKGRSVVTLDADLQNPPEEIPRLLAALAGGADYVGTIRRNRRDPAWRRLTSRAANNVRERLTGIRLGDQGSMLRAYDRSIVDGINRGAETNPFVPALAWRLARSPREIEIAHEARAAGTSRYSLFGLIRLHLDAMAAFSGHRSVLARPRFVVSAVFPPEEPEP